jgi:FkbH-like protein
MPLRRSDFACIDVGWDIKTEGLRRIAEDLNIGTDSLVFLDDNPTELELVRQLMPEVECVQVPSDPELRPMCLDRIHSLDRAIVTAEDLARTTQYQANNRRRSERHQFTDLHAFLTSLETRVLIKPASPELLARVHQLFSKTNQFNLTSRRYTLRQLQDAAASESSVLLTAHAADRFGDLGWIAAVLVRNIGAPEVHIDNFVLSCRVMGRAIESAILNRIKQLAFEANGAEAITAEFLPTAKNVPVREFFEDHGFSVVETLDGGGKRYRLKRQDSRATPCDWLVPVGE